MSSHLDGMPLSCSVIGMSSSLECLHPDHADDLAKKLSLLEQHCANGLAVPIQPRLSVGGL